MNFALNLARQFCVVARWGVVDYSARHLYGLYGESLYRYNCIRQTSMHGIHPRPHTLQFVSEVDFYRVLHFTEGSKK